MTEHYFSHFMLFCWYQILLCNVRKRHYLGLIVRNLLFEAFKWVIKAQLLTILEYWNFAWSLHILSNKWKTMGAHVQADLCFCCSHATKSDFLSRPGSFQIILLRFNFYSFVCHHLTALSMMLLPYWVLVQRSYFQNIAKTVNPADQLQQQELHTSSEAQW